MPLYLATLAVRQQSETITFNSGVEMLDTFGPQQGGSQYRRLIEAFQRVFGATIFFVTDTQLKAPVFHQVRFNFMSEARIWYGRNLEQPNLPGDCRNEADRLPRIRPLAPVDRALAQSWAFHPAIAMVYPDYARACP